MKNQKVMTNYFIPPMKNGVSPSKLYLPKSDQFASIGDYLCKKFAHIDYQDWQQRCSQGLVLDEQGESLQMDMPYKNGLTLYYYRQLQKETPVPFEHQIIFENEAILVVDKPHFLAVTPTGKYVQQSLLVRLKNQTQIEQLAPAHRLDRETAGVILFTKHKKYRGIYQQLFAEQKVFKQYHAIAGINPQLDLPCLISLCMQRSEPFYTMAVVDGVFNSQTHIEMLQASDDGCWGKYLLTPITGKLHQLRVHLSHLGIPIVNDSFYPKVNHAADGDFSKPLQLLAKNLAFIDPLTDEFLKFTSMQDLDFSFCCQSKN